MPTGIADYSELLLTSLAQSDRVTVEAFCPPTVAPQSFPVRDPAMFPKTFPGSDRTMFHVGNSEHHDFLYPYLFERPDVLVLHDLVVHHARLNAFMESPEVLDYRADMGDTVKRASASAQLDAYRREVAEAYPKNGAAIAEIAIRIGGGNLLYAYPLYEHLVRRSRLTLVHGTTARDDILERCPESDVKRVRMGISTPDVVDREKARERLGLPHGLLLASFGLVTPEKRISMALRALVRVRASGIDARYVLVGGTVEHYDARAEAVALGIDDAVTFVGRVPEETFWLYAFAADICLNLRYPSAGENLSDTLEASRVWASGHGDRSNPCCGLPRLGRREIAPRRRRGRTLLRFGGPHPRPAPPPRAFPEFARLRATRAQRGSNGRGLSRGSR